LTRGIRAALRIAVGVSVGFFRSGNGAGSAQPRTKWLFYFDQQKIYHKGPAQRAVGIAFLLISIVSVLFYYYAGAQARQDIACG
jgi:hypothetical protein